jgi:hypothetical protein
MAVSVAYMRNELVSRSTSHTNRTSWEQQQSYVSHGISQLMTLIVNESRRHSIFEAPWLPPTIQIFTYLMRMGAQSMTAQSNHVRAPSLDIGIQPVTLEPKPRARPSPPRSVTEATQSSSMGASSYMLGKRKRASIRTSIQARGHNSEWHTIGNLNSCWCRVMSTRGARESYHCPDWCQPLLRHCRLGQVMSNKGPYI